MTLLESTTFDLIAAINATDGAGDNECMITIKKLKYVFSVGKNAYTQDAYYVTSQAKNKDDVYIRTYYVLDDGIIKMRYYDGVPSVKQVLTVSDAITHGRMIVK